MTDANAVLVHSLTKGFGGVQAVDHISFDVRAGEVFGLLGPNGAGKTTTLRILVTLLNQDEGSATIFGRDTKEHRMDVRRILGYVPQALSVDATLTGRENVWLFARLFEVPRKQMRSRIDEAIEAVGLDDAEQRLAGTYSGGMLRRLELAQALVNRPRLLVLDEPTIGLDPVARASVWERVNQLRHELDMTVLLTTHYMDEADSLCDRIALMHRGTIRASGTPQELKNQVGPNATLDDVFREFTGDILAVDAGRLADVRSTRSTARRLG